MGYDEGGLKTVDWKADPARRAVLQIGRTLSAVGALDITHGYERAPRT